MMMRWTSWAMAVVLIGGVGHAQSKDQKKELEKVQKQIQQQQKELKKLETQERNFFATLEEMQKKQETLAQGLQKLKAESQALAKQQAQTKKEKHNKQKTIESQQDFMKAHIKQLYTHGQINILENLFSRSSLSEKQNQQTYIQRWVKAQDEQVQTYQREVEALNVIEKKLVAQAAEKKQLAQKLTKQNQQIEQEEKDIRGLLASITGKKENYRKTLNELEATSQKIEKLLEKMETKSSIRGTEFAQNRGQLLYPVPGKITRRYGAYEDKTLKAKVYHKGMDFQAKAGQSIRSIFQGRVVLADWFEGYGKVVIVDHGSGYHSLYAHLDKMKVKRGDQVKNQGVLGTVGQTGSLQGDYLYFELRKKGVTVNPSPWFGGS